jgi:protein tyrosine kinase modulator
MSLRQFLLALRARFRVFAVALIAVVLAAGVASYMMPKSYRATVSLLVDAKDEQSMGEAALRALGLPQEHLSYLQTQADILASPKVARRVVEQLKLAQNPAALTTLGVTADAGARVDDVLVDRLQHALKVETSQSNVISGTFTCGDPRLAATIANGFATAYVDTMLELRVAPNREAAAWFDEQLKGLRASLEEAQRRLRADQDAKQQQLAQRHPERLPQVREDGFIQQLRADLLHGEEKLRELSTRYGVNHPTYQSQVSENLELRERLQSELRKAATSTGDSLDRPAVRAAARQQAENPGESGALEPVLQHNVDSAERAYDTALQRYISSQVDSRASQTNVSVLSPAAVPLQAYRPDIRLNLALALVTGLGLGCALVALLETLDPRVRSAEDLARAMQLPLLAVLSNDGKRTGLLPRPAEPSMRALPRPG